MNAVDFLMSLCVLCNSAIIKNGDKNLIVGRSEFNVKAEISTLEFSVDVSRSVYICKVCLSKLKKRRALISNLRDVNSSLRQSYSAFGSNPQLFTNATTKSTARTLFESDESDMRCDVQPTKRVALQGGLSSEPQAFEIIPLMSSTPSKEHRKKESAVVISPIPKADTPVNAREDIRQEIGEADQNVNKRTTVQVRVEWPSKHKVNNSPESLESLGKMLCRGTYKQIAGAVWKNPILKKHVQQLFLKEVDRECSAMCSVKHPSCLRSPSKKDLQSFSFKKLNAELETKAPLFSAVLWTASLRKSKRDDQFWQSSVCMSAAVLLKNRCPSMTAIQLLNTIILYHTGIIVSKKHFLLYIKYLSCFCQSCLYFFY